VAQTFEWSLSVVDAVVVQDGVRDAVFDESVLDVDWNAVWQVVHMDCQLLKLRQVVDRMPII
jgi:hypothetical protein